MMAAAVAVVVQALAQQLAKCGTQKAFCLCGHSVINFVFVGYWKLRQNLSGL